MNTLSFLRLVQNAALLLSLVLVFDVFALRWRAGEDTFSRRRLVAGVIIGAIGVVVMLTPWVLLPGLLFDTRSVLLSISGLFFGAVPTLVAMTITAALRLYQGGPGVWPGVSTVLVTATLGLIWRRVRRGKLDKITLPELYMFGLATHVVMLGLMFTLPWEMTLHTLRNISAPVLIVYPLASMLLGGLMVNRLKREKIIDERRRAEEALYAERQLLRTLIDNLPNAVYAKDAQGRKTLANRTDLNNIGLPEEEVLGKTDAELFPPEIAARFVADDQAVLSSGTPIYDREELLTNRDGKTFWQLTSKVPLYDADGKIAGLVGIGHDVTERRLALEALRESEQRFRLLVENAPDAIFVQTEGRFAYLNEAAVRLYGGNTVADLLGQPVAERFHPDLRETVRENIRRTNEDKVSIHRNEELHIRPDGTTTSVEISSVPIHYEGHDGALVFVNDITERKQAESQREVMLEALRENEEKYRALFEQMSEGFALYEIITDTHGMPCDYRFLEVNPAFEQLTGLTREHCLGKTVSHVFPDIGARWIADYGQMILTGKPGHFGGYDAPSGHYFEMWVYSPRPGQLATLVKDITERRQQELERAALLEAEHEQRLRAETLRDVTLALASALDVPDVLVEILHQAQRLVPSSASNIALVENEALHIVGWRGYSEYGAEQELAGMIQPLSDYPVNAELIASGKPYIAADTHDDPRWRCLPPNAWIRAHISLPISLGEGVLGVLRLDSDQVGAFSIQDVERLRPLARAAAIALENAQLYTQAQHELEERTRSQAALEASERKFREMLENIRLFAVMLDLKGRVTFCNDFGLQLVGMEHDTMLGCDWFETFIPPEMRGEMRATFLQNFNTGNFPPHFENEILTAGGTARALIAWNNMVVRDSDNNVIGVSSIGEDITARRQAEHALQASEAWLRSLVDSMDDVILSLDTGQHCTALYGRWKDQIDLPENPLGRTIHEIFGPDAAPPHVAANDQALTTGASVTYEWETPSSHFQTTLSPLHGPEGEIVGLVSVGRNITALKHYQMRLQAALDEKTLMLSEIHHRIKNNLQVILGLLDLQFGATEDKGTQQMLRESQNRIKAIALIHERLYQTPGESRVGARLYFHSLVRYLTETYDAMVRGIAVEQSIDNLELDIDLAIPCALIVNELISNALKYAFPPGWQPSNGAPPTLRVVLHRTDDHVQLAVADNGVGLPESLDMETSARLGLRLIRMLARQIDGKLSVEQDEGTCIAVAFAWSEEN